MAEILIGFASFVFLAAAFVGGFALGWKMHSEKTRPPTPEELGEQERRRLIDEQMAFKNLMNYSSDVAYGLATLDYNAEGE